MKTKQYKTRVVYQHTEHVFVGVCVRAFEGIPRFDLILFIIDGEQQHKYLIR